MRDDRIPTDRRRIGRFLLMLGFAIIVAPNVLGALLGQRHLGVALADNGPKVSRPQFSRENDTVENRAIDDLRKRDLGRITLRQITGFHNSLVSLCGSKLPKDVRIRYLGSLAYGRENLKILGQEDGLALDWSVEKSVRFFTLWVSTERTNQTLTSRKVECVEFFVNVDFVDEFRSVDEKMPELGGRSVRELLSFLSVAPKQQPPTKR